MREGSWEDNIIKKNIEDPKNNSLDLSKNDFINRDVALEDAEGTEFKIIQVNSKGDNFLLGDSIKINNSIAVWYALKTTINYLENRSKDKIPKEKIEDLDKAAANNLRSIYEYFNKNRISDDIQKEEEIQENEDDNDINTKANQEPINKNDKKNNKQVQRVNVGSVLRDINKLAGILNPNLNGNNNNNAVNTNENIRGILQKYSGQSKPIEDVVFNELIKSNFKRKTEEEIIENEDELNVINNKDIFQAKYDFDELKKKINSNKGINIDENNENNEPDKKHKIIAEIRDKKVFLSKAAKEFKDKVGNLDYVKKSNTEYKVIEEYNGAITNLDTAIKDAVREKIQGNYTSRMEGYKKGELDGIFKALGLDSTNKNVIEGNNIQKDKDSGATEIKRLSKEITDFVDKIEGEYITGNNKDQLLTMLSKVVKIKLMGFSSDNRQEDYLKAFFSEDKRKSVLEKLKEHSAKFKLLSDNDKYNVYTTGKKIEVKPDEGNVGDLKKIASDKELETITQKYGEYNKFNFQKFISRRIDTKGKISISEAVDNLIKDLLLSTDSKKFNEAEGMFNSIASDFNEQVAEAKKKDTDNRNKGKYLQDVFLSGLYPENTKKKNKTPYVSNFINEVFSLNNNGGTLSVVADNLERLSNNENFQLLLSNVLEDDFAVGMIENNFERLKKDFDKAGRKATVIGKMWSKFWENFTEKTGKKRVMIASSAALGFSFGMKLASIAGLSLTTVWLPMILSILIIGVTILAVMALASIARTLVHGVMSWRDGRGFYKATTGEKKNAAQDQKKYAAAIYNAFLTFGADEKKLQELVRKNKDNRLGEKSSEKKFLTSMLKARDFILNNRKILEDCGVDGKKSPFAKINDALKSPNVPDIEVDNNVGNNFIQ